MSNLLPRQVKRAIALEYRIRIGALWCFVLSGALLIGTLLFAPAYFIVNTELRYASSELRETENAHPQFAETIAAIERANALGQRLGAEHAVFTLTDALREIDAELGPGIAFEGMTFVRGERGVPQIEISGTASTREELARFIERLKRNPYFVDASVPFGQLAQATNAPFTATLTVRPSEKRP